MTINELATPAILVDLDVLERNITRYQSAATANGKQLWPMTKTHKSTEIAKMQLAAGAAGLLCGTIDECEAFAGLGVPVMYAYPPAGRRSIERMMKVAKRCRLILRLDGIEAALAVDAAAKEAGLTIDYTNIIDAGLGRFGVSPENASALAKALSTCTNLHFCGLSTHPGQVYGAMNAGEVRRYEEQERQAVDAAVEALSAAGFPLEIISSGSTPTHMAMCSDSKLTVLHPGNYVFHDAIQIALGAAKEEECALRVLATVISHPAPDRFIIDAGAKCLGLDQGAHGCASVKGFGHIVGHPELTLYSLSEEVGKIHADGKTRLSIGDQVQVIPNHACSSANCTSRFVTVRDGIVAGEITVDVRGNCKTRLSYII